MSLFSKLLSSEPDDIQALREKIKSYEKGFELRKDYEELQMAAACYLEISVLHPEEAKQTAAFMSGRNALEQALREGATETIKPSAIDKALDVYAKKHKEVFLRSLYDEFSANLKKFIQRMQNATYRQICREQASLNDVHQAYVRLAAAAKSDGQWFHDELTELAKSKNNERHKQVEGAVKRIYELPKD